MNDLLPIVAALSEGRRRGDVGRRRHLLLLVLVLAAGGLLTLCVGQSVTSPVEVLRVLSGETVQGASFTVGTLRLPRAVLSILAGMGFGLGGVVFQVMLRNPLASPDIIGISSGASAAAVFAIVVLSMSGPWVSAFAILAGLGIALAVWGLSFRSGGAGARLILVGIGISAMTESFIAYLLSQAPDWTLQDAMRWLTGSVNGARLEQALPLLAALAVCGGLILLRARDLEILRLGDDAASALGVRADRTRAILIVAAVVLVATATAVTGPIAFVAFLSGPIAAHLLGRRSSLLIPAALVGALLVLLGDWVGQVLLPHRYPVGVVTGALGAPYLVALIVRSNRSKGSP